jgi:hypothetical protein
MDGELVKAGCEAHHDAIHGLPKDGVCSEAQLTLIYASIGRMVASVSETKTMDVYRAVKALVDPKVPEYLMSKVNEADARKAYDALLKFTKVVKANPIKASTPVTKISSFAASSISAAATSLGMAAYPFMKGVDWTDELYAKPIPGKDAQETLKAIDRMIVMGSKMDSAALKEAAKAHVKAIQRMDSKGVLTQGDFIAVLAGLGKAIASVPASTVMDVYNEMGNIAGESSGIPKYMYSKQNPTDAVAAYDALIQFKDTVRAYQPDSIEEAAAKLSSAAYPFMKQVPWNDTDFLLNPGTADPVKWTKAVGKIIEMGATMDMELVKAGCGAHHAACTGLPADGVCSEAKLAAIYAAIGRMIASVPESKTMEVYEAVKELVDPKVPEYLMAKVGDETAARAAYDALLEFVEVVKANPITPSTPESTVTSEVASSISAAASELSAAAYPLMKGVDWTDDLYRKPVPGKSAQETLKAVDKMIVMGSKMDGHALREAAMAHAKAIERMDGKGVLTEEDFKAILVGLGKMFVSVPRSEVMGVYSEMSKIAGMGSGVPKYLFAKQDATNAMAAYDALIKFSDVVKKSQPGPPPMASASFTEIAVAGALALQALLLSPAFQ